MNFLKFLISRIFLINAGIALVLLVIGYFVLVNYLDSYTKHGEKVAVPSVMEAHVNELDQLLVEQGFRYEIMDSIWDRKKPKGIVLDQKPSANDLVKAGRKIYVTINARSDKKIKISLDNIIGSTPRGAMDNLASLDIRLGPIEFVDHEFDDIVLALKDSRGRKIKDGQEIKAGSEVMIVAGRKSGSKIKTPKVVGMPVKDAFRLLLSSNLNANINNIDPSCVDGLDSSKAIIVKQNPNCYEEIRLGQEVSIFYTCDTSYVYSKDCK